MFKSYISNIWTMVYIKKKRGKNRGKEENTMDKRDYIRYLREEEKSESTIKQYKREIELFYEFSRGEISKETIIEYKDMLKNKCSETSVNTKLAAINNYLKYLGKQELRVKQLKIQKKFYCCKEKELTKCEYLRLIKTAEQRQNEKLSLIMQSICASGIRVSELKYITIEAVKQGEAVVRLKNKTRVIMLPGKLRKKLICYAKKHGIKTGSIFITKKGKPIDRSNIWKMMKTLCVQAKVAKEKVFPHNLRHLFARIFYKMDKDIAKLADILGHSSINTTRIYIITSGAEHRRKIDRLELVE